MCIAPTKLFEKLTDTRNPQGIAAVAALPSTDADEALRFASREHPLIALHGIADPGNLGTIIRTTDWFGGNALLISEDSVDPFNPKVVRSSMGSLFRVRIGSFPSLEWLLEAARSSGRKLTVTTAAGGIPPSAVSDPGSLIVVLGSEAHGLPSSIFASADMHVTIPGGGTESLNLAVSHAILQYAWHP
jgi:TrmH family RNA methyltransferase